MEDETSEFNKLIGERIVGGFNELRPEISATLGGAVGSWLKNKATIAIARDFRADSRMMKRAFTAGLMSTGVSALDFHGVPTPLLQFYIRRFGADAGVMFTSGHYEGDKTGIRIFDETGAELTSKKLSEIRKILVSHKIRRVPPAEMTDISDATGAIDVYIAAIKNIINRETVSKSKFRVVIDAALGPVSYVLPNILTDMNVDVIAINSFNPKIIPKNLPNSESLVSLAKTVKANDADLGVAFDVEGSRVVICDENGTLRSSDRIAAGLAARVVQQSRGVMVISESMSKSIENIVESYGEGKQRVYRIRDQPGAIAKAIRENQAMFGASDTGSFWAPAFTVDSDGIFTSLKLLELLAAEERPLSRYLESLPQLPNNHREIFVPSSTENHLYAFLEYIKDYPEELGYKYAIDALSGTKIMFEKGWVNVAPSSMDPKTVHMTSEADPFNVSNQYMNAVQQKIDLFSKETGNN
ncbi:MAG: hypothetical protein ACW98K_03385 [Candidatus Kariarchaeaceae archaeon]|jgi:phosphomannomutase